MKTPSGCKLFGAHQALSGMSDSVVLFHSVVGCNFGTMTLHAGCDMAQIRQTCTIIGDQDVVFGGEESLRRALCHVEQLYHPRVIFVVSGCVSEIVQDDIRGVCMAFRGNARVIPVEAAGFRGDFAQGYEAGLCALLPLMEAVPKAQSPVVNLLGFGADELTAAEDIRQIEALLGPQVRIGAVPGRTGDLRNAASAGLNLVLGRGKELAEKMQARFGIPYEVIDYPYGLTGAQALWSAVSRVFSVDYREQEAAFREETGKRLLPAYARLQALYGMPAAILGEAGRTAGLARFLTRELGMEICCQADRSQVPDLEDFYDWVRSSETAILFGSSFEQELAEEMEIPLVRFDYPVFDRVRFRSHPYAGVEGTLCLLEDIINEVMAARSLKGALYQ